MTIDTWRVFVSNEEMTKVEFNFNAEFTFVLLCLLFITLFVFNQHKLSHKVCQLQLFYGQTFNWCLDIRMVEFHLIVTGLFLISSQVFWSMLNARATLCIALILPVNHKIGIVNVIGVIYFFSYSRTMETSFMLNHVSNTF